MTIVADTISPPCVSEPETFEPLHHPPPRRELSAAQWRQYTARRAAAHRQCAGCPLMVDCLYRAVVEVDVSGFVACTTERDRRAIRRELGIDAEVSTTQGFGVPNLAGGPVSSEAVLAMRQSHPHDTCLQLAERLGCSTSTVKRHLRRAREERDLAVHVEATHHRTPTVDDVLDCFDRLESSQVA
jgi:hypothetical protein